MSDDLREVGDELSPEERLGTIIAAAATHGGYADSVPLWRWKMYGEKLAVGALKSSFERYLRDKRGEKNMRTEEEVKTKIADLRERREVLLDELARTKTIELHKRANINQALMLVTVKLHALRYVMGEEVAEMI